MRTITIGRNLENDIVYSSPEISGEHAEMIENGDGYTLVDHSKNGTFVNGRYIHHASCSVRRGDSIVFAGVEDLNWHKLSRAGASTVSMRVKSPTVMVTQREGGHWAPFGIPSMVCGILSVVCVLLSVNLLGESAFSYHLGSIFASFGAYSIIFGLALGIVGLSLGASGTRKTRGRQSLYRGMGMLRAGKACGIVGICLNGLELFILFVVCIVMIIDDLL